MGNQTLTEISVGKQGERKNECFLKVGETRVLGQIRVFAPYGPALGPTDLGPPFLN